MTCVWLGPFVQRIRPVWGDFVLGLPVLLGFRLDFAVVLVRQVLFTPFVHLFLLGATNGSRPERLRAARVQRRMAEAGSNTGWKVDRGQRAELLQQFPPRYPEVVADHVTLKLAGGRNGPVPEQVAGAEIVGRADDGKGVDAMVVRIDGTTDRPDGSTWHITWSLGPGRQAWESNKVIAAHGWEPLDLPMPVLLHPARWSG
jgi:hypothetical protein